MLQILKIVGQQPLRDSQSPFISATITRWSKLLYKILSILSFLLFHLLRKKIHPSRAIIGIIYHVLPMNQITIHNIILPLKHEMSQLHGLWKTFNCSYCMGTLYLVMTLKSHSDLRTGAEYCKANLLCGAIASGS